MCIAELSRRAYFFFRLVVTLCDPYILSVLCLYIFFYYIYQREKCGDALRLRAKTVSLGPQDLANATDAGLRPRDASSACHGALLSVPHRTWMRFVTAAA